MMIQRIKAIIYHFTTFHYSEIGHQSLSSCMVINYCCNNESDFRGFAGDTFLASSLESYFFF